MKTNTNNLATTKNMVRVGFLSAIAFILMYFEVPSPFAAFLTFDLSDVPAVIAGISIGPVAGVLVQLVKNLLHLTVTWSGAVGELANFLVGISFVIPVSLCYKYIKNRKFALPIGLIAGTLCMPIAGALANYFILLPLYYPGEPVDIGWIMAAIVPFNFVKGLMVSVVSFGLYASLKNKIKGIF